MNQMNGFSHIDNMDKLTLPLTACGENVLLIFYNNAIVLTCYPRKFGMFLPSRLCVFSRGQSHHNKLRIIV